MAGKRVRFPEGQDKERAKIKWDSPEQLETFFTSNIQALDHNRAKEISVLLYEGWYVTEEILLNADREGLKDAGIPPAVVDIILRWAKGQKEESKNGMFLPEERIVAAAAAAAAVFFIVIVVLDGFDSIRFIC